MGLVCHLLAGEGQGNLPTYCPQLCENPINHRSHQLTFWHPAEHLHFVYICDFKTLDRFKCSWLTSTTDIWNGLPVDMISTGGSFGLAHSIKRHSAFCL